MSRKIYTTEKFIQKAKQVFGDIYDYSDTHYISYNKKVLIYCPKHGAFEKSPSHHLSGQGCPECAGRRRYNSDSFISKAKKIHGEKYIYSRVHYENISTRVAIICPSHGEFMQLPHDHLSGKGCPICAAHTRGLKKKQRFADLFIERAIKKHGNKYDYSEAIVDGADKNICIICPIHGKFYQSANNHLHGKGCPKCAKVFMDTQYFIDKAKQIHGDKYVYEKVVYVNAHRNIIIGCSIHGEFRQTPNRHLQGGGCPQCGLDSLSQKFRKSIKTFISEARIIHGDKYDYSKVIYINNRRKVEIICPIHGSFKQVAGSHLVGMGCPKCSESHLEREVRLELEKRSIKYVYEKRFRWLGLMTLDFYLPEHNIAIECQGVQHFEDVNFTGLWKKFNFEAQVERDIRKQQLCKEHGVKLYYYAERERNSFLGDRVFNSTADLLSEIFEQ